MGIVIAAAVGALAFFWLIKNIVMALQSVADLVDTVARWGE